MSYFKRDSIHIIEVVFPQPFGTISTKINEIKLKIATLAKLIFSENKNKKTSWVWWHTPVVPATLEAEGGEADLVTDWNPRKGEFSLIYARMLGFLSG